MNSPSAFYWEESKKPWFGPTKRAKEHLIPRVEVLPPKKAAVAFAEYFGDDSCLIQQVRFIDFVHRGKGNFRFTIALVWTDSDAVFRQKVYDSAPELVALTGWYPLPQGERIGSRIKMASLLSNATQVVPHCLSIRIDGRLVSVENAVDEESGCSIRVTTTHGSFLLDSGLVYTGDISLASNRHDFIPDLARYIDDIERPTTTLLLDATMAGRNLGSSDVSLAEQVIRASNGFEDVFLVASDIEQLLYAYLDLFFYVKESPQLRYTVSFLMPHRLRHLFQVLHANFISRQLSEADPFLLHQYGKSMSAWAESRSLYWLDQKNQSHGISIGNKRMWFCSANALPPKASESTGAALGLGRWSDQSKLRDICGAHILNVDTFAWAQHSDAKLIEHVSRQLSSKTRVVLFHNYERRLSKFILQKNLSNCHFLSRIPLAL